MGKEREAQRRQRGGTATPQDPGPPAHSLPSTRAKLRTQNWAKQQLGFQVKHNSAFLKMDRPSWLQICLQSIKPARILQQSYKPLTTRFFYSRSNLSAIPYNTEHTLFPSNRRDKHLRYKDLKRTTCAVYLLSLSPQFITIQTIISPCQCRRERHYSQWKAASPFPEFIFFNISVFSLRRSRLGQTPYLSQRTQNVMGTWGLLRKRAVNEEALHTLPGQ